jgi:hypothetical protein
MKTFLGILIGMIVGFITGYVYKKNNEKKSTEEIKVHVGSTLKQIGELRVYRVYMKEIVTTVDHIWGTLVKNIFHGC